MGNIWKYYLKVNKEAGGNKSFLDTDMKSEVCVCYKENEGQGGPKEDFTILNRFFFLRKAERNL